VSDVRRIGIVGCNFLHSLASSYPPILPGITTSLNNTSISLRFFRSANADAPLEAVMIL
jgi:hypothetical protein